MKYRKGFVSNSSSSSFIVIDESDNFVGRPKKRSSVLKIDKNFGRTDFGWGPEIIVDTESKIIFSWIQATYLGRTGWLKMLGEVVREHYGASKIIWSLSVEYNAPGDHCYIDHQSASHEGENIEMFDDKETLKRFLFGRHSYIQLDHDNK